MSLDTPGTEVDQELSSPIAAILSKEVSIEVGGQFSTERYACTFRSKKRPGGLSANACMTSSYVNLQGR